MSGIFKYTPNRTASSTPNRRSAFGTGFGSPSLNQDATMDNTYSMRFRSPSINALTEHGSPVRSLREIEEELSSLRKEKFNLKLRIFFLEQQAGISTENSDLPGLGVTASSSGTSRDGSCLKQNIDLKVEVESLRRELVEKQDLLCQAAKAIEVLEEGHRRSEEKHREMVSDLNNRIEIHQLEIKSLEKVAAELQHQHRELQLSSGTIAPKEEVALGDFGSTKTVEIAGESLLDFIDTVQHHSELSVQDKLKALELDTVLRQYQEQNEELQRQAEQTKAVVSQKTDLIASLEAQLKEVRFENAELREKLEENAKSQADAEIERLKKQMFDIRSDLAEKLCVLDETEEKLKDKTAEHVKSCRLTEKLLKIITEQEKEIARMKRNSNISLPSEQGQGNGNDAQCEVAEILDQDRKPVSQTEYDSLVQRAKLLQQKNETLIQKLCSSGSGDHHNDRNIIIKQLNDELIQAREEAEKAQKWRKECADLCAVSTIRLEELAGFLDSLLKNKDLVCNLSTDRRKAIRKAVDRSLDLSRSLNMSISVTGFSLTGNTLAQLSCLSGYLENSIDLGEIATNEQHKCDNEKENYTEHMNFKSEASNQTRHMIETLQAENKALRGELLEQQQQLQQRSKRRESKERKLIAVDPISDSEAWSEPDRGVSLARIGLEDRSGLGQKHLLPVSLSQPQSSTGAGCAVRELSSTSENELAMNAIARKINSSGSSVLEVKQLHEQLTSLTVALREKDCTIQEVQSRLVEVNSQLKQEQLKIATMESDVHEKSHLVERWESEAKESREKAESAMERLVTLGNEIRQKDEQIEKLRREREQASVDLRVAVMKLETMRSDYEDLQQRHKTELDQLQVREQKRLEELKSSLSNAYRDELQQKQQTFNTTLEANYISKNIHQEKLRELEELHYRLEDAHNDISSMAQAEERAREQLTSYERTVAAMKKNLDDATLQASKAAVERTKALAEKRQLEQDLNQLQRDLQQLKDEKNALNEKLVTLQAMATTDRTAGRNHSGSGNAGMGMGASALHEGHLSSTTTEDEEAVGRRRFENSSPDLGIESDPGRLSNVELAGAATHNSVGSPKQRLLLRTLELTKSMSNLLLNPSTEVKNEHDSSPKSGTQEVAEITTIVKHDCAKIEADFAELKRRYKVTRQSLNQAYDNIKSANKRKEQLEVDIKQQIHKTRAVLKTVHNNMEQPSK
ncbi:centrosomin isoform X2 [Anopheles aquasalis]|uniref:centrosomin isoform X2 n=1 Tax=Anopheles aquasalis TaxID=42839 RepID=UPI00215B65DC|nr:centrosomin isoform X2 [Anopheles aquasalis]XP_050087375.1 centrosomin isoform X2 [Anopheles aquasalis]XP_050087376.1 centrosomin isoform X2 [Anopheles aquasalis]XP_050087377.1 centrosomin isoform X2 [Anopheles aquasalis]XP_050087378.1 centrosomin isoform X2 [Anopheles aquasalis]XP_050087379.1 centrosomin isoform X2 [Anopheles aquasalis]XP_050087380.1 centrosomin isoform X2 [Anopheles aquasalis]XP_050087381.1 centrosomin isoform X2 [Anopheles aquasalis]